MTCLKITFYRYLPLPIDQQVSGSIPRDPRFAGSNPVEIVAFFKNVKILSAGPLGGTLSRGSESDKSGSLTLQVATFLAI